jgi:anti-anti-sigma factor
VALTVTTRLDDDFVVLEIAGALTLGPPLNSFRETIRRALNGPRLSGVILSVSGVTVVDSAGLGELTVVYTLATKRGCGVRLVGESPSLGKMLAMTRIDGLLPSAADVTTAKKELRKR